MSWEWEELSEEDYKVAEANGISRHNAWQRVEVYGWSVAEAITKPVRKLKRVKHDEEAIKVAEENGITRVQYRDRILQGWSPERASTTPIMSKEEVGKEVGKSRSKFTQEQIDTFERNGIPRGTVRQRLLIGWSMEEAISVPIMPKGGRRKHVKYTGNRSFGKPFIR